MASTKSGENAVQTSPVEISQQLQDGEKFVKWDEVCSFKFVCSNFATTTVKLNTIE